VLNFACEREGEKRKETKKKKKGRVGENGKWKMKNEKILGFEDSEYYVVLQKDISAGILGIN